MYLIMIFIFFGISHSKYLSIIFYLWTFQYLSLGNNATSVNLKQSWFETVSWKWKRVCISIFIWRFKGFLMRQNLYIYIFLMVFNGFSTLSFYKLMTWWWLLNNKPFISCWGLFFLRILASFPPGKHLRKW